MKSLTKILILVLLITSFIPLKLGILCIFSQIDALDFFSIQSIGTEQFVSPDQSKLFAVLGSFVLGLLVFQILTISWLLKEKMEGYTLAYFVGGITIGRGLLMLMTFDLYDISDTRIVASSTIIGAVILLVTFVAKKQKETTN